MTSFRFSGFYRLRFGAAFLPGARQEWDGADRFLRLWESDLCYCEGGFLERAA